MRDHCNSGRKGGSTRIAQRRTGTTGSCGAVWSAPVQGARLESWSAGDPRSASVAPSSLSEIHATARPDGGGGQAHRQDDRLAGRQRRDVDVERLQLGWRPREVRLVRSRPSPPPARMPGGHAAVPVFVRRSEIGTVGRRPAPRRAARRPPTAAAAAPTARIGEADARRELAGRSRPPARRAGPRRPPAWPGGGREQVVLAAQRDRPDLGQDHRHQAAARRLPERVGPLLGRLEQRSARPCRSCGR